MAQQYDVTLKLIFGREDGALFPLLFGGPVVHWHNIELPQVENKRLDMLAETATGLVTYLDRSSPHFSSGFLRSA